MSTFITEAEQISDVLIMMYVNGWKSVEAKKCHRRENKDAEIKFLFQYSVNLVHKSQENNKVKH